MLKITVNSTEKNAFYDRQFFRKIIIRTGGVSGEEFGILNFDKPVVCHDNLGAADHSSVD